MQLLIYRLTYPILWFISRLPWKLFYLFSDMIFLLTYYIIRYRREAVTENLNLVFPYKTNKEIYAIQKAFYKHLCDIFLEMIKSMTITEEEMLQRFKIVNIESLRALEKEEKSVLVMFAHYASYEWSNSVNLNSSFECIGVYKKLKNPHFDELLQRIRARFGSPLLEKKQVFKQVEKDKIEGKLCMYGLISDQTPRIQKAFYWSSFMRITVPMVMGAEILAKKLDLPVYYMRINKKKRGFYEAEFVPITKTPQDCDDYYIVNTYIKLLEAQINEQPEYYLWTHKRWKFRDQPIPENAIVNQN